MDCCGLIVIGILVVAGIWIAIAVFEKKEKKARLEKEKEELDTAVERAMQAMQFVPSDNDIEQSGNDYRSVSLLRFIREAAKYAATVAVLNPNSERAAYAVGSLCGAFNAIRRSLEDYGRSHTEMEIRSLHSLIDWSAPYQHRLTDTGLYSFQYIVGYCSILPRLT